jgi:trimethylamine--corrinoid protein Co-methyltransferase
MAEVPTFRPRLKVLNKEQVDAIHASALEILATMGVKMEHPGALVILKDAGCKVENEDWVKIPASLVENAIKTAPKKFTLYDQNGNSAMPLENGNSFYGTGSDTNFTIDVETGVRRPTVIADVANFAKLVDGLDNISFNMSMANAQDVPVKDLYIHAYLAMIKNTNKPMVFIADSGRDIAIIHKIACAIAGSEDKFSAKPFMLNYSEAISPLRFPENIVDKLIFCAEKGIPICLPSGSNAGGGAPVTLAGAMAMGIAENLAGLVIHQMTNKGAPFWI